MLAAVAANAARITGSDDAVIYRVDGVAIDKKAQLGFETLAFSSTMEGVCSAQLQAQNKHSRRLKVGPHLVAALADNVAKG